MRGLLVSRYSLILGADLPRAHEVFTFGGANVRKFCPALAGSEHQEIHGSAALLIDQEKVLPGKVVMTNYGVKRVSCVNQPRHLFIFGPNGPQFQATGLPARASHLAR